LMARVLLSILLLAVTLVASEKLVVHLKDYKDAPKLKTYLEQHKDASFECILSDESRHEQNPILASIYHVHASSETQRSEMQRALLNLDFIDAAYTKTEPELAVMNDEEVVVNHTVSELINTPLYENMQGYLDEPPFGVGAKYMWSIPGGMGDDVTIVDVEGGWTLDHEDLHQHGGKLVSGVNRDDTTWLPHGTAVFGEYGGWMNDFGVTGIASRARTDASSIFQPSGSANTPKAIIDAADYLRPGDIMLIELHQIGPNNNYIAVEWWPDNYAALKYATDKGVIVIAAAGNGNQDLDNPVYDRPQPGFPSSWNNPFRRNPDDSGCVLAGAGAPKSGNYGPPRSRLDFSNYGSAVDAQGWGREVTTCGYGDLQGGNAKIRYTKQFSGTSSASPIVVGSIASIQGALKANNLQTLTPSTAREALRNTGSEQQPVSGRPTSQRIGNLPDLEELWNYVR